MRRSVVLIAILTVLTATACDTRPRSPAFDDTTTTSTTLPGVEVVTTTTITLPPPETRVVGTVLDVTDGDTIRVLVDGAEVDVRLVGINAPEFDECWGPESTAYLMSLVQGSEVLLIEGADDVDSFGRLLRHVYLETPTPLHVNADLVATGHAVALHDGSDGAATLKALEARAFQSGYGMWGTYACGDKEGVAADRPVIRVSDLAFDPEGPDASALDAEYITVVNEGYDIVPMAGWTLRDESSSNRFVFPPGVALEPGQSVTVVTGCEGGPVGALHWCSDQAVWSNGGDTAMIMDTLGNAVVWHTYDGTE
ncbi:MAG: lamin tail domain-containing protein [Acidimicrobiia bacterium]